MDTNQLIDQGNQHRSERRYHQALACYAQVFAQDFENAAAFNNYGNVLREMGHPQRALPFLESAVHLAPEYVTAKFNRAVTLLLMGDYARGWPAYETRWQYEHLAGTLPKFSQPRWSGQDLKDKTILVVGEQGHGDNIQFVRFLWNLHVMGARVKLQVPDALVSLLGTGSIAKQVGRYVDDMGEFDYWIPIMSLPGVLGITLENLAKPQQYLNADPARVRDWHRELGPKYKTRVGFSWSGRPDSWLNQHKGVPFEVMCDLVARHPEVNWINLQIDATAEQQQKLADLGVQLYSTKLDTFADTAALVHHLDLVISMDSAVSHLSAALGRPTWIMLNRYATDWRWLLNRDDSPWYVSARLFRQSEYDRWTDVTAQISRFLSWYKV